MRTTKGQSGKPDEMTEDQIRRLNLAKQGYSQVANISTDSALTRAAQEAGIYCQIDRKSIWGNPFILGDDGNRKTVIRSYSDYLENKPSLRRKKHLLRGRILGCWCYPEPCHGSVLIRELAITDATGETAVAS